MTLEEWLGSTDPDKGAFVTDEMTLTLIDLECRIRDYHDPDRQYGFSMIALDDRIIYSLEIVNNEDALQFRSYVYPVPWAIESLTFPRVQSVVQGLTPDLEKYRGAITTSLLMQRSRRSRNIT